MHPVDSGATSGIHPGATVAQMFYLGTVVKELCTIASLEQKRLSEGNVSQLLAQTVDLGIWTYRMIDARGRKLIFRLQGHNGSTHT